MFFLKKCKWKLRWGSATAARAKKIENRIVFEYMKKQGWFLLVENGMIAMFIIYKRTSSTATLGTHRCILPLRLIGGCSTWNFSNNNFLPPSTLSNIMMSVASGNSVIAAMDDGVSGEMMATLPSLACCTYELECPHCPTPQWGVIVWKTRTVTEWSQSRGFHRCLPVASRWEQYFAPPAWNGIYHQPTVSDSGGDSELSRDEAMQNCLLRDTGPY